MSTINLSDLVPLGRARRELIPLDNKGKPISPSTAWRWITKGLMTPTGERVKLKVIQVGGRPFVTRDGVEEFFAKLTEAREVAAERDESSDSTDWSEAKTRRLKDAGLI